MPSAAITNDSSPTWARLTPARIAGCKPRPLAKPPSATASGLTVSTTAVKAAIAGSSSTSWAGSFVIPIETKKVMARTSRNGRTSSNTSWPWPDSAMIRPAAKAPSATG